MLFATHESGVGGVYSGGRHSAGEVRAAFSVRNLARQLGAREGLVPSARELDAIREAPPDVQVREYNALTCRQTGTAKPTPPSRRSTHAPLHSHRHHHHHHHHQRATVRRCLQSQSLASVRASPLSRVDSVCPATAKRGGVQKGAACARDDPRCGGAQEF
jgi:hypothetical protein